MRISPFYSAHRGAALIDIWHDNDICPQARAIPALQRRRGLGYLRQRCPQCAQLSAPVPMHWQKWLNQL